MIIRPLKEEDIGYALTSWAECHKTSPGCRRAPWWSYRREYVDLFKKIVDDPATVMLGAYDGADRLLGFLIMTPGKRVHAVHWCQIKRKLDGKLVPERRDLFFRLLEAAELGQRFVYTLRGPRVDAKTGAKSLDEILVNDLRAKGVAATYIPLKEYLQ